MFNRRDCPACMLLALLIVLVMLTLSQILVVHNGRYRGKHTLRRLRMELRELDRNIYSLMQQEVPSIETNRKIIQNRINQGRFVAIIREASRLRGEDADVTPDDKGHIKTSSPAPSTVTLDGTKFTLNNPKPPLPDFNHKTKTRRKNQDAGRPAVNYCPEVPPGLLGRVFVDLAHHHNYTEAEILQQNVGLLPGGRWQPADCTARHRVAVIIPYRDRYPHLRLLLSHLHPILSRQQLAYTIFVVEQHGSDTFNKARLMNAGFLEALRHDGFHCFVFHDVDLVPEDDRNMYSCSIMPRHMSVAIDEMGYKLAYQELVGGVLSMRTEHFQRVNGYSNMYWGWGAEDDDMAYRILHVGLKITRPPEHIARYKMVKHTKRKPADWRKRTKLLYTGTRRYQFDGLNSLEYKLVSSTSRDLYTHLLVDIGKPPAGF